MKQRFKTFAILGLALTSASVFADCVGYSGPGGPCYTGPGGGNADQWNRPSPYCK